MIHHHARNMTTTECKGSYCHQIAPDSVECRFWVGFSTVLIFQVFITPSLGDGTPPLGDGRMWFLLTGDIHSFHCSSAQVVQVGHKTVLIHAVCRYVSQSNVSSSVCFHWSSLHPSVAHLKLQTMCVPCNNASSIFLLTRQLLILNQSETNIFTFVVALGRQLSFHFVCFLF